MSEHVDITECFVAFSFVFFSVLFVLLSRVSVKYLHICKSVMV